MYYTGFGPGRTIDASYGYILSAVSKDGLNWSKEPGIRIDVHGPNATHQVLCPDVIPLPDGRWRMYFEARVGDRPTAILSAVSTDGLQWEPEEGVRIAHFECRLARRDVSTWDLLKNWRSWNTDYTFIITLSLCGRALMHITI